MRSDRSCQFPAIWLLTGAGQQYTLVNTVIAAAETLLHHWPSTGGKAYTGALVACLDALQGNSAADVVPEALMRAADEAFICHIRVIGGGNRSQVQHKRMSQRRYTFPKRIEHLRACARSHTYEVCQTLSLAMNFAVKRRLRGRYECVLA